MEQREQKGLALGQNRKFPHHLELPFFISLGFDPIRIRIIH